MQVLHKLSRGSCETVREFPMFGDLGVTLQAARWSLASPTKHIWVVTGCGARRGYFSVLIIWLHWFWWLLYMLLFLFPVRTTEKAGFLQRLLRKCHLQNQTPEKGITLAKFHTLSCAYPLMTTWEPGQGVWAKERVRETVMSTQSLGFTNKPLL